LCAATQHFGATLRYDGYCQSLAEAGLALEPELVAQGYFDLQSGLEATRALLSLPQRPTAIFASNDEMAVGALMAAREFGLDVPATFPSSALTIRRSAA
jgi:LacI family transcriptional regulator